MNLSGNEKDDQIHYRPVYQIQNKERSPRLNKFPHSSSIAWLVTLELKLILEADQRGFTGAVRVATVGFGIKLGLSEDEDVIWVLPQNMPVINAFIAVSTQWRHGPSGQVTGLDYAGVRAALKALRIKTGKVFRGLQVTEAEELEGLAVNKQ